MAKRHVFREPVVQPQDQSYSLIALTRKQVAKVSAHRYEELSKRNWFAWWNKQTRSFYATAHDSIGQGKTRTVYMHRLILGLSPGDKQEVDHIDRDTLNNRDNNLRRSSHSQNKANATARRGNPTGLKGVRIRPDKAFQWEARIQALGKQYYLGLFTTKEQAANAYDEAAKRHFGEFAHLNFP